MLTSLYRPTRTVSNLGKDPSSRYVESLSGQSARVRVEGRGGAKRRQRGVSLFFQVARFGL